jgi:hypothetical protein
MNFIVKMVAFLTDSQYTEPDGMRCSHFLIVIQLIKQSP